MGNEAQALNLLGLAMRAGQVISGDGLSEKEIRAGRAGCALLDADASDNTRGKYMSLCKGRDVPLFLISGDLLGRAIGKPNRMVAVMQKGPLQKKVTALLSQIGAIS